MGLEDAQRQQLKVTFEKIADGKLGVPQHFNQTLKRACALGLTTVHGIGNFFGVADEQAIKVASNAKPGKVRDFCRALTKS